MSNKFEYCGQMFTEADFIVEVLGYRNPMDYWREQDVCIKHRERLMKKGA